jgi:hypothetical protein
MTLKFRYIFTAGMIEMLENFSRIHIDDERKLLKIEWKKWCIEVTDTIQLEKIHLEGEGYEGTTQNIIDKMFFSVRYYYQKKIRREREPPPPLPPPPPPPLSSLFTKKYRFTSEFLHTMDLHIAAAGAAGSVSPVNGYLDFIDNERKVVCRELLLIRTLYNGAKIEKELSNHIFTKIKKTYSNRHYICRINK